jgi:hypothetical protein
MRSASSDGFTTIDKETKVNTLPYESREEDWDSYDEPFDDGLPGRPRRQYLTKWSALLLALIVGAAGFYAGIRVEKNQLAGSSTGSGSGFATALASRLGAAGGGATGSGTGTTASGRSSASSSAGSGFASRFGGGGGAFGGLASAFAGGSATIGTVSSVDGDTIYVQETSGNTVKVTLSGATKITKSEPVSKSKVYPGDSVIAAGLSNKNGSVSATSLTDSGARSTGSTSSSGSGSGSGSSAISSLF